MIKVLFLIHDLGQGGAEKVLINLVNNMDKEKFDITVMALFGGGVNESLLNSDIKYIVCHKKAIRGNSKIMKLFSPRQLYKHYIKDSYDVVVSYLEGPSARIVSGCPDDGTKLASWIHCTIDSKKSFSGSFRSYKEALKSYRRFDMQVFVSNDCRTAFCKYGECKNSCVIYNVNDTKWIKDLSKETVEEGIFEEKTFSLVSIGKIEKLKGVDRLCNIHKMLVDEGYNIHTYVLGKGSEEQNIKNKIKGLAIDDSFFLLGHKKNPYKYMSKCDLFVCSSHSEGFSTAATEALILGLPVCTVKVSGMSELLGENNEYGIITENSENALYDGIKQLLDDANIYNHYKQQAVERGKMFSTEKTVKAAEQMLTELTEH